MGDGESGRGNRSEATAVGPAQVDLSWQASGDNVGVTGYRVYRDSEQVASLGAATSYDTGAAAGTTYDYEVRAVDAAGNVSDPSKTATATRRRVRRSRSRPRRTQRCSRRPDDELRDRQPAHRWGSEQPAVESFLRFTVAELRPAACGARSCACARTRGPSTAALSTRPTPRGPRPRSTGTTAAAHQAPIGDKGTVAANTWVEYDVSQFVTGNGTYSFSLADGQ